MSTNKYSDEAALRLKDFFRKKKRILCQKGDILITPLEGGKLERVLFIEKGRVIEYDYNERNEKIILNIFKEGSFVPMNYALSGTPVKYFFETDADSLLRESTVTETIEFLEMNNLVTLDLMSRVAVGLDGLMRRLSYALGGTLESKIIAELLLYSERFGYEELPNGARTLNQELSVTRLSQLVGASREATSRGVSKLLKDQKISRVGKIFTIN